MKSFIKLFLLTIGVVFILSGCALSTAIEKRNLDVQTKMSDSIFLEPVAPEQQVVYVRVRNTTDKDINIEQNIKSAFESNGFVITKDPKKAEFIVQANLLKVGKGDAASASSALESGFGGAIVGAGIAAATGASSMQSFGIGAVVGGLAGVLGNALVKDIYYTMITDVEIRQRASTDETIEQTMNANSKQGSSASIQQNIKSRNAKWKIYRTRVVSTANKVNLDFPEAKPTLVKGLTRSLSGLL